MKGNKTVHGNMGCHSERTVVLHKHYTGAKQVSKPHCHHHVSVFLIMFFVQLSPVCCKMSPRRELLQCLAVVLISHRAAFLPPSNKHSKCLLFNKLPVSLAYFSLSAAADFCRNKSV